MSNELRRMFEDQLVFELEDGTTTDLVSIGSTPLQPQEVLGLLPASHEAEFDSWLWNVFRPRQAEELEEILRLHSNSKRFRDLCVAVANEQVVPFVGSGMSAASGLPTWANLLRQAAAHTECSSEDLEAQLVVSNFEGAAELIANASNPHLVAEQVEYALQVDSINEVAGPVRLLPIIFPKLVVTTNLDQVLEHCYESEERRFSHVLCGDAIAKFPSLKSSTTRTLLKLHGDAKDTVGRVLSSTEYEAAYGPNGTVRPELANLYRNNHMLFIGCSLGPDRTLTTLGEVHDAVPQMPKHFAFLRLPHDDATRRARENQLTAIRVHPIWYEGSHDDALTALLFGIYVYVQETRP